MDPYLYNLLIIIAVLGGSVILIFSVLVLVRFLSVRNRQKYREKAEQWENIYLDYLHGDLSLQEAAASMGDEKRYYWLWRFFAPYLGALSGADFAKTKDLCRETGLIAHYRKKLKTGSIPGKAQAARVLGSLRCHESLPEMLSLLESKNPLLVQAAAQGLARSGKPETLFPAARALLRHTFFTYEGASEILAGYGREVCPLITDHLKEETARIPEPKKDSRGRTSKKRPPEKEVDHSIYLAIMIDLLGHFQYREALPLLKELLGKADEEVTVHILKAFLRLGEVPEGFDLKPFLKHHYWVVRNFSAKAWKLTGDREALPILEELLSDRNWWVRFHAAEALRSAGDAGQRLLEEKAKSEEQKAAEVSSYALQRSEG